MDLPLKLKVSKGKGIINYVMDCPTPSDYVLIITLHADADLLKKIWNFRKNILLRTKGIDVRKANLEDIQLFEVPEQYHKFMKIATKRTWVNLARVFQKDKIILLSHEVTKAVYKLNDAKGWDISITFEGIYTGN